VPSKRKKKQGMGPSTKKRKVGSMKKKRAGFFCEKTGEPWVHKSTKTEVSQITG